jgi:hypothetical protein
MIDLNKIIKEYRSFLIRAFRIYNNYEPVVEEEPIKRYIYADSPDEKDFWYLKIKNIVIEGLNRLLNQEVSLLRKIRLQELYGKLLKARTFNTLMLIISQINYALSRWDKAYEIGIG